MFLIAQKKCLDALNAMQKTPAFYNVRFLKKIKKNLQKLPFFSCFDLKWVFLQGFS